MTDLIVRFLRSSLPEELAVSISPLLAKLENADFQSLLGEPLVRKLVDIQDEELFKNATLEKEHGWRDFIPKRAELLLSSKPNAVQKYTLLLAGFAALGAFLQSNVTGPPLSFDSAKILFPSQVASDRKALSAIRSDLIQSLGVDGEAAYKLTPNIELLCFADAIIEQYLTANKSPEAVLGRLRIKFIHQRLLSTAAPTLQKSIYDDLETLATVILDGEPSQQNQERRVSFMIERASIHTHHGFDKLARVDLEQATKERSFQFALTGLLGKRTKYQQKDVSQLVVLARSAETTEPSPKNEGTQPKPLDLEDDTLLESISFAQKQKTSVDPQDNIPPELSSLDPEKQPILHPLDSIILLSLASSITNTQPAHGLTREETLPYATRVLDGGSSNWQIYTQALLLRSRIEGYKSRTVERGLLQLQALVDQVIADTTSPQGITADTAPAATTFLPRAKEEDTAPASQRLQYIYQLCSPTRWELEAELAARWVSLGGLRSALEIYERLEMWPEAALCWAATDRDDKARKIIRKQLFHSTDGDDSAIDDDTELWNGVPREHPPADAPRLYCILADIDKDPSLYEKAWEVSKGRYARAQRELAKHYYGEKDYAKASLAFSKSLKVKQLDHSTWFALGCALLALGQFKRAVESFSRAVQLDDSDAEAWSNLAAALLNLEPDDQLQVAPAIDSAKSADEEEGDEEFTPTSQSDPQRHKKDALKAFKQASKLKHNNHRIWENLLTVASSVSPPSYMDILTSQRRLIELRGPVDGEKCIDMPILSALVEHVFSTTESPSDLTKPGLPRLLVQLFDKQIAPLITSSAPLWNLVAKMALLRNKPSTALEAHEKAWRAVTTQPGWEHGTEDKWDGVVDATVDLVGAYESLGPRERTEGLGAGGGEFVMKDWRFKGRSAIRGIKGRGKESWEGTKGWGRLEEALEGLKI
ncbi:TPR-like protein [Tothia fuscella]|uniref:TPR-like protein n=1 Tax=Tothia fuscella TaxID=1048955 RepID=A0A9P4NED8_9PEZI|nr:TPR-like protein [Tothia fuscella]